jgi:hypothetical protein
MARCGKLAQVTNRKAGIAPCLFALVRAVGLRQILPSSRCGPNSPYSQHVSGGCAMYRSHRSYRLWRVAEKFTQATIFAATIAILLAVWLR